MGSQFWVLGVGEWHGGWVRGVGGGVGIFREIYEKFRINFKEISGKIFGDPKTGNSCCETAKQCFDNKWSVGEQFYDHPWFTCWISKKW